MAPLDAGPPILNLTTEEKRVFSQLFTQADTDKIGVVTGEVAVKFFERTKLAPSVLGEVGPHSTSETCQNAVEPAHTISSHRYGRLRIQRIAVF